MLRLNSRGQGVKTLASVVFVRLFGFALCCLPLRKLSLALFAVIVFSYLRDEEPGKGFYDGLWKFNFTICFIGLIFSQRHFPFPKRRTWPAGGRNRERISCSSRRGRFISSRREWRGSVCFPGGVSCTRPDRRGDSRFHRRPFGCRACLCSPRSTARPAPQRQHPRPGPRRSPPAVAVHGPCSSGASWR